MNLNVKKELKSYNKKEMIRTRHSRKMYIPLYIMVFILIFTISIAKLSGKEVNDLAFKTVLIFSGSVILFAEIHRIMHLYEINSQSLVHKKGFFVRKTKRVDLLSVSDADSRQNPWQRLLNYGDVHINLYSGADSIPIKNINNPEKFVDFLEKKMSGKRIAEGEGGMKR